MEFQSTKQHSLVTSNRNLHWPFLPRTIGTLQGPEQSLYQPSHPYHILRYTVFSNVSPLIHYSRHWRNLLQPGKSLQLCNLSSFRISWGAAKPHWHYQSIDLRQCGNGGFYIKVYESTWNFSVFSLRLYSTHLWHGWWRTHRLPSGMTRYDTQRLSGNFPDAIFKTVVQQNMGLTFWKPGPQNQPKFISPFMAWWHILKMTQVSRWKWCQGEMGGGVGTIYHWYMQQQVFPDPISLLPRKEAQGTCPKMRSSKLSFKPWRFPKTPNTWHINLHSNFVFSSWRSNTSGNTEWMSIKWNIF